MGTGRAHFDDGMKATVCRPGELGMAEVEAWRSLQASDPATVSPFLSPEFALAAGRWRPDARVAVFERAAELVGFWAFTVDRNHLAGPVAPGISGAQGIVHSEGFTWDAEQILAACGLGGWTFDHLVAPQARILGGSPTFERSSVVNLNGSWEDYLAWGGRVHHKDFYEVRRKRRRLENDFDDVSFEAHHGDGKFLPEILRLKSERCHRKGWRNPFSSGWATEMLTELANTVAPSLTGITSILRVDGRVAAGFLDLRGPAVHARWITAFDTEFRRYSPGLLLFQHVCQTASWDGISHVDLGKGEERWKASFSNHHVEMATGIVHRRGISGALISLRHRPHRTVQRFFVEHREVEQVAKRAVHRLRSLRYKALDYRRVS
jgi:CelD/BcsL family acetyltransferase involved in cellulose biosynthesis